MFRNKPEVQTQTQFFEDCGLSPDTESARFALQLRGALANYAGIDSQCVFANSRIVADLGISPVDSLNLVDILLEFESTGLSFSEPEMRLVFEANKEDGTVSQIVQLCLAIIKDRNPNGGVMR